MKCVGGICVGGAGTYCNNTVNHTCIDGYHCTNSPTWACHPCPEPGDSCQVGALCGNADLTCYLGKAYLVDGATCTDGTWCMIGTCKDTTTEDACNGGTCVCGALNPCAGRTCEASGDCCAGYVCDDGTCVECVSDGDCTDVYAPYCDTTANACVECLSTTDCPAGDACVANACGPCSVDADCGVGYCVGGVCVECLTASDCPVGEACVANYCGACTSDADCGVGSCDGGVCVECLTDAVCTDPALPFCDPTIKFCVACLSDSDCTDADICSNGTCVQCVANTDCAAGEACIANSCGPCAADTDCAEGEICAGGVCGPATSAILSIHKAGCPADLQGDLYHNCHDLRLDGIGFSIAGSIMQPTADGGLLTVDIPTGDVVIAEDPAALANGVYAYCKDTIGESVLFDGRADDGIVTIAVTDGMEIVCDWYNLTDASDGGDGGDGGDVELPDTGAGPDSQRLTR